MALLFLAAVSQGNVGRCADATGGILLGDPTGGPTSSAAASEPVTDLSGEPWEFELLPPIEEILAGEMPQPVIVEREPPVKEKPVKLAGAKKRTKKGWDAALEFGLNGSTGNTETFNTRVGARGKYSDGLYSLSSELTYSRGHADSKRTENELTLDTRHQWEFDKSLFSLFWHGSLLFDEFTAFDTRLQSDAGIGYSFVKTDDVELTNRLGAGFSREFGGPADEFVPELTFGIEFEYQFAKRHKLKAKSEFFHDLGNWSDYRINSRANWEILIDPEFNLSLTLGARNRYDSTPNGSKPNDLVYTALLLWKF